MSLVETYIPKTGDSEADCGILPATRPDEPYRPPQRDPGTTGSRNIRLRPYARVKFQKSYPVMTRMGYCSLSLMSSTWDNIGIEGSEKRSITADPNNGDKTLYEVSKDSDERPTIWLERKLGALLLHPSYVYESGGVIATTLAKSYTQNSGLAGSGGNYAWTSSDSGIFEEASFPSFRAMKAIHLADITDTSAWRQITSNFKVGENESFLIWVAHFKGKDRKPWFAIHFGQDKYVIHIQQGKQAELRWGLWGEVLSKGHLPKTSEALTEYDKDVKDLQIYAITVQRVHNHLIISNGIQIDDEKASSDRNWIYTDSSILANANGITVPESEIILTFSGGSFLFFYLPVEYTAQGEFRSDYIDRGYQPTYLYADLIKDTPSGSKASITVEEEGDKYKFEITMNRGGSNHITPAVYGYKLRSRPLFQTVFFDLPDILGSDDAKKGTGDILSVSGSDWVDRQEYRVVLNNRGGKFNGLHGIFPIEIDLGYYEGAPGEAGSAQKFRRLTGFVTDIAYSRPGATRPTCTLTCRDKKVQLEEIFGVNLPIYDGWGHIAAIMDLMERGGMKQSDVMAFESGGYATTQGDELPLPLFLQPPLYMFPMGKNIWDCMQEVRKWSQWWLFFNHNGYLYYIDPANKSFSDPPHIRDFKEVPEVGGYNELKRLDVMQPMQNIRNAIIVMGLDYNRVTPQPIVQVEHAPNELTDTKRRGYVPWYRWVIHQDVKLNSKQAVKFVARETYNRVRRPRVFTKFDAWGQPDLYPLDIVRIYEETDETGIEKLARKWRITSVTHEMNAETMSYNSNIECEWADPSYEYDPAWP